MECPLAPLEGVPIYEYIMNLTVYLNLCSSPFNCTLGCSTLVYLVLTAHPAIFHTQCGTEFCVTTNLSIQIVIPNPTPTAAIFLEPVRTHKHDACLLNLYHKFDCACKKVVRKWIPEKYYNSLSSLIIGLAKVTSLQIFTHLITNYAELEY